MITNRDIEIAFVRAQQRINDRIDNALAEIYMPDMANMADMLVNQLKGKTPKEIGVNPDNPIANEEI